jgi:hypothetical protein
MILRPAPDRRMMKPELIQRTPHGLVDHFGD